MNDRLLIDLKEKKSLTWPQIADFFPGRSSGALQLRYCTKLRPRLSTPDSYRKGFYRETSPDELSLSPDDCFLNQRRYQSVDTCSSDGAANDNDSVQVTHKH